LELTASSPTMRIWAICTAAAAQQEPDRRDTRLGRGRVSNLGAAIGPRSCDAITLTWDGS